MLMTSTVICNQLNSLGQRRVHSTSMPIITALMTRTTIMNTLNARVLTSQLATMLGGLNREFMILTRFLRLSAAVTRFLDYIIVVAVSRTSHSTHNRPFEDVSFQAISCTVTDNQKGEDTEKSSTMSLSTINTDKT